MWRDDIINRAKQALTKKPKLGEDISLSSFKLSCYNESLSFEEQDLRERALSVGIDLDGKSRSATYLQVDHSVLMAQLLSKISGLEVMDIEQAIERYDWLRKYFWNIVEVDQDKFTAAAELYGRGGYFIRIAPNTRIKTPVQACLFVDTHGVFQAPHNVIVAEPGSEVHILTGCTTGYKVKKTLHAGVTEIYVKHRAKVTFTMIHNWPDDADVRPRTGVLIEDGGVFVSNYISLRPFRSLQTCPVTYSIGKDSSVKFNSIMYVSKSTHADVGTRIVLSGKGAKGESIFKSVATGNSVVVNRGEIVGMAPHTRGHLECRGLVLCPSATIHAVPELIAKHSETDLSHEAAIGRLQEEQLHYLMARGVSPDEAISLLVKGFLDPEMPELPPMLQAEIKKSLSMLESRGI